MTVVDAVTEILKQALQSQGVAVYDTGATVPDNVAEYFRLAIRSERVDNGNLSKSGAFPIDDRRLTVLLSSCVIGTKSQAEDLRNLGVQAVGQIARILFKGLVSEFPTEIDTEWEYSGKVDQSKICAHTDWSFRYQTPRGTLQSSLTAIRLFIDGGTF